MNSRLARRTATHVRATLVVVAFTGLAALGFTTARSVRPFASSSAAADAARLQTVPAGATPVPCHTAPAACPMPAGAFRIH